MKVAMSKILTIINAKKTSQFLSGIRVLDDIGDDGDSFVSRESPKISPPHLCGISYVSYFSAKRSQCSDIGCFFPGIEQAV